MHALKNVGNSSEDSSGGNEANEIVKISINKRRQSIEIREEKDFEALYDIQPGPKRNRRRRENMNSPFSHEQVADSIQATRNAV